MNEKSHFLRLVVFISHSSLPLFTWLLVQQKSLSLSKTLETFLGFWDIEYFFGFLEMEGENDLCVELSAHGIGCLLRILSNFVEKYKTLTHILGKLLLRNHCKIKIKIDHIYCICACVCVWWWLKQNGNNNYENIRHDLSEKFPRGSEQN